MGAWGPGGLRAWGPGGLGYFPCFFFLYLSPSLFYTSPPAFSIPPPQPFLYLSILVARPCIHRPRPNFAGELLEGVWVPPGAKMAPSPPPYPSQDQGFLILDPNLVDFGRQLGDFMLQL